MIISVYNNDGSDYCDYEGTVEEIKEMCSNLWRRVPACAKQKRETQEETK